MQAAVALYPILIYRCLILIPSCLGSPSLIHCQVLGRALRLIRFPLMNIEEFASGPAQSGLLLDSEVVSLFLYFTVNPKPNVSFADVPRCCLTCWNRKPGKPVLEAVPRSNISSQLLVLGVLVLLKA